MRHRRAIHVALLIVALAACPIAVNVAKMQYPEKLGPVVLGCAMFFTGCAVALRSRTIAGALVGVLACAFVAPLELQVYVRIVLAGATAGLLWEVLGSIREPATESPAVRSAE